jgi:hypothetical protein
MEIFAPERKRKIREQSEKREGYDDTDPEDALPFGKRLRKDAGNGTTEDD